MAYTTLSEAKTHLQIESGYTEDNTYITTLIDVCELAVQEFCNGGLSGYTSQTMPVTVKQATLLLIAHYYTTRQPIAYGQPNIIPYSFGFLLDFYRNRIVE